MVFSSVLFLFFFLPITLLGCYLFSLVFTIIGLGKIRKNSLINIWLLGCSAVFYAWGEGSYIFLMLGSSLIDYVAGLVMSGGYRNWSQPIKIIPAHQARTTTQKICLIISLTANLCILAYFKYTNFGIENLNATLGLIGLDSLQIKNFAAVTLPLGISFYTFQSMSYTIDVYRGQVAATRSISDFVMFVVLFPQLVAGPIVRYKDIAVKIVYRNLQASGLAYGVYRFSIGLAKKVLIANQVGVVADEIFKIPNSELTAGLSWLAVICYTLQIYFDFSGYSDMAIGLGRMLGFRFLENFNYPYISTSIREFWRRWHISLSTWFRDYLYVPLGGNRCSKARNILNMFIVFLLCGLWHGAAWNFILWGLFHGLFLSGESFLWGKSLKKGPRVFQHLYTMIVVMIGWVMFRSENLTQVIAYLSAMLGYGQGNGEVYYVKYYLQNDTIFYLILGIIMATPIYRKLELLIDQKREKMEGFSGYALEVSSGFYQIAASIVLLFLAALYLSSQTHNPFIYFRF